MRKYNIEKHSVRYKTDHRLFSSGFSDSTLSVLFIRISRAQLLHGWEKGNGHDYHTLQA